eukprot:scaffold258_cov80-Skeletonema_menzelii.AAC.1
MDWFSSVFGVGSGGSLAQQQQPYEATEAGESTSPGPPSPNPRRRKRNKRHNEGAHDNNEDNNDDNSGRDEGFEPESVSRHINFGINLSQYGNASDDEISNINSSTEGSDEDEAKDDDDEGDKDEDEVDALNTTLDSVDINDDADAAQRVYINDAPERPHVQLEPDHWRDMTWDPREKKFYYKNGGDNAGVGVPKADGYNIVNPRDANVKVSLVLNLSRDIMLASYEGEIAHLNETLDKLDIPATVEGVEEHLFGAQSRFVQTMARRLKKEPRDIHKFLATVYFSAELGLPTKRLEQHPNIKFDEYMDTEALNSFWRDIANIGKGGVEPTYLWQDVEESLNKDCRDLFLAVGRNNYKLRIALDDDKVHFQFSSLSVINDRNYLCGLSPQQHVKANRRGFTIDSAVSAATGFPLCFRARREGFSSAKNYEAMLRYMFQYKFSVAGAAMVALNNIIFCSDRGYWQVGIILFILQYGGSVFGTLMRNNWVPFTYDQKHPGWRRVIKTKYGRNIFLAFGRWCTNMLKIMAFRSGRGSVSLAMDSDGDEEAPQLWELCFKNNGDAKWYQSNSLTPTQRHLKAFQSIDEIVTSTEEQRDIKHHLSMFDVTMLTCQDKDFSWAMMRKFAFTSTSSEAAVRMAAPYLPQDEEIRSQYEKILKYSSMENHLSDADDGMSMGSEEGETPIDASFVTEVIISMRAGRTQESLVCSKREAKRILDAMESLSSSKLSTMLVALGMKSDRAANQITDIDKRKKLKIWTNSIMNCISAEDYKFPYEKLLNAKELQLMLEARAGDAITNGTLPGDNPNPTTKALRIEALQCIDDDPAFQQSATERDPSHNSVMNSVLTGVVKKGFLQPMSQDEKKELRLGHQNEPKYLVEYYNDSKNGRVPGISLCDIKRPGMAMHHEKAYVRSSADGIGIEYSDDGSEMGDFDLLKSHTIECKCRAQAGGHGSLRQAKTIQRKVVNKLEPSARVYVDGRGEAAYLEISSSDQKLMEELIPKSSERIQILHHAYTYGLNKTVFLVGSPEGRLLYGLIVTFEDELLTAYGEVLEYLYKSGLHLFYSDNQSDLPLGLIENIIRNDVTLKQKYTVDDLVMSALICREMRPGSSSRLKYPIPACDMLVPHEYALWNASKGGSDTVTRFTWNCLPVLPIRTPQSVMIARYIMIYGVLHHRLIQAVTGTKKLDTNTDTIQTVRERANKRLPFHKSLGALRKFHLLKASDQSAEEHRDVQADFQRTPAPTYNSEEKDKQFQVDHSVLGQSTGSTPVGKGRGTGNARKFLRKSENYSVIKHRNNNCTGFAFRLYKQNSNGEFEFDRNHSCDLCKRRNTSTMCSGCKRILCFDVDRREKIIDSLKGNDGDRLREEYPALSGLSADDAPAYYTEVGVVNDRRFYMGMSCWHLAHPNHFCSPCNEDDAQLASVIESGELANSPQMNE